MDLHLCVCDIRFSCACTTRQRDAGAFVAPMFWVKCDLPICKGDTTVTKGHYYTCSLLTVGHRKLACRHLADSQNQFPRREKRLWEGNKVHEYKCCC